MGIRTLDDFDDQAVPADRPIHELPGIAATAIVRGRTGMMVNNLLRDTKAYVRKARLELSAAFTLHTFRKSFGQNQAEQGTPPRTLAELFGHSDTRVMLAFYNQATDGNRRAAAATMDRLFGSAMNTAVATG